MTTEEQLRARLRKIQALYAGATTKGEREAAAAAADRVKSVLAIAPRNETPLEYRFSISDPWKQSLFKALCRRYELAPYRYKRQRRSTVRIRVTKSFVDKTLWPQYKALQKVLDSFLSETTARIIREEVEVKRARVGA